MNDVIGLATLVFWKCKIGCIQNMKGVALINISKRTNWSQKKKRKRRESN